MLALSWLFVVWRRSVASTRFFFSLRSDEAILFASFIFSWSNFTSSDLACIQALDLFVTLSLSRVILEWSIKIVGIGKRRDETRRENLKDKLISSSCNILIVRVTCHITCRFTAYKNKFIPWYHYNTSEILLTLIWCWNAYLF